MRLLKQRGDTIVEVLIAIGVVSSVLAITYGIMNKNLAIMRNNQERTEVTKLAQAEIEALKTMVETNQSAVTAKGTTPFCIRRDTNVIADLTGAPATDFNTETYTVYANCTSTLYYYYIVKDITDVSGKSYYINVRWPTFNGGRSQVQMKYRIP